MKWFGEHIWPFKSRMRNDVIIENDKSLYMGTSEIISNSGSTTTLKNIDSLDATTISTLTSAGLGGDITGVTAGDGLNGGGSSGAVTLNLDTALTTVTSILDEELVLGRDEHNKIDFQTDNNIKVLVNNVEQFNIQDGLIKPRTTNTIDLGTASFEFKDAYFDGTVTSDAFAGPLTGNVTGDVSGSSGSCTGASATVTNIGNLTGDVTSSNRTTTLASAQPNIESIGTDGDTLTILSDIVSFSNSTANMPYIVLTNQHDTAASSAWLAFTHDRKDGSNVTQAGEDGDYCGLLRFTSYNDAGTPEATDYGYIRSSILDASDGAEKGRLDLMVGNTGGATFNGCVPAIVMNGGDSGEADVTVGYGAASVVTIPGTLDVTNGITGGYRVHYKFMGYNGSNSTANGVYEYANAMQDTRAPLKHDQDHNATITTAMDVSNFFTAGGQIVPHNCTVKNVKGWAHSNGTSAEHKVALVRLRPVENDASKADINPVLVQETTWTSLGNDKLKLLDGSIITAGNADDLVAGDMLMTMIKDDTGSRTVYFNLTVEVEF